MMQDSISPDTQAILLLCDGLSVAHESVKPLTPGEYNSVAKWLMERSLRPSDLLEAGTIELYRNDPLPKIDVERITELLAYGGSLAIQAERWLNSGFWIISRPDGDYPDMLKKALRFDSPTVLFGVGSMSLLSEGGVAIVGSRDVDHAGTEFTTGLAEACARGKINVISGGARGVDQVAMASAINEGGKVVGVLANDLAKAAVMSGNREAIHNEQLVLISPYHPKSHFHVGTAMGRNKVIYGLSEVSVVVSSGYEKGGTWQGAVENLKKWHVPLFVRDAGDIQGNIMLMEKGALSFPVEALEDPSILIQIGQKQVKPDSDDIPPYHQCTLFN